jgi:CelD/BcsL family acetyltransferase involved in cellulose biosynthesis
VQVRTLGPLGFRLSRAYVYPSTDDRGFLRDLLGELNRRGVCFARIGDTMFGSPDPTVLDLEGVATVERHTFVLDVRTDEEVLLAGMHRTARNRIRKTQKEGVVTCEADGADQLDAYWRLSKTTTDRIRAGGSIMEFPREFFAEVFERMIQAGMARLILARRGDTLLAGVLCFAYKGTMLAYQAASTRDRRLTGLHGPTACFWSAIRTARGMGLQSFDLGGCTPGLPKTDSRYGVYFFKQQWGGELTTFYNGEAVLSPLGFRLQERILGPLWSAAHPAYFKLKRLLRA